MVLEFEQGIFAKCTLRRRRSWGRAGRRRCGYSNRVFGACAAVSAYLDAYHRRGAGGVRRGADRGGDAAVSQRSRELRRHL
jgi:hypothetical protein